MLGIFRYLAPLLNDVFLTHRNDGTEFGGSIYQKVNDNLETAVNLAWTAGNSNTRFGIAAKYQIDADASFSVRVVALLLNCNTHHFSSISIDTIFIKCYCSFTVSGQRC